MKKENRIAGIIILAIIAIVCLILVFKEARESAKPNPFEKDNVEIVEPDTMITIEDSINYFEDGF